MYARRLFLGPNFSQRFALILTRTHQAYTIGRLDFSAEPAVRILRYGSITLKSAVERFAEGMRLTANRGIRCQVSYQACLITVGLCEPDRNTHASGNPRAFRLLSYAMKRVLRIWESTFSSHSSEK